MSVKNFQCPNCGAKVKKNQEKCDYCGAFLHFNDEPNTAVNSNTTIENVNNNASICNGLNSTQKKLENSKTRNPAATRSRLVGVPLTQSRKPF